MPSADLLIITAFFLLVIVLGTHYIRTWAFNRHEAITFECSAAAFLISVLLMIRYGVTGELLLASVILLIAFAANAFSQWHFYMVLQEIIGKVFAGKASLLREQGNAHYINDILQTMASVAIMPSFSRFIEESKMFNNPGNLIGLVKSITKRQRFQKTKYLMRECFAENVNMIGPCKPSIDDLLFDETHIVSGAIHANDLALEKKDEIKGLLTYDVLGWGAMFAVWYILFNSYKMIAADVRAASPFDAVITLIVILVFTCICHVLRHFGFARYESFTYEMSYIALITSAFFAFTDLLSGNGNSYWPWIVFGAVLLLFLLASFANRSTDKGLHKEINKKFEDIIYQIDPDSETNRIKRKFLQNMKVISEWAVVPFPGGGKSEILYKKLMITKKAKSFELINQNKKNIPDLMEKLVDHIVPEFSSSVNPSDFKVKPEKLRRTKLILDLTGILSVGITIVCICVGVL